MTANRRVLVVDDMPAIHEDFRKILRPPQASPLADLEAFLFDAAPPEPPAGFEVESAFQGQEGLDKVVQARDAQRPFALAFVDMRMPPGWNGVETIERLWQADPRLQVVICTAYSDQSLDEVMERLDGKGRIRVLRKPMDAQEIYALAGTLARQWDEGRSA